MTCGLGDYKFVKIGSEGGERLIANEEQVMKLKKKKKSREDPLTIGEPLPDQGTCSHYRKSKRWFRFSCCSKLYPCDICHDGHEDHSYDYAKKHVCGLCSREQTIVSGKPCVCGHEFEKAPQKQAFWEGGKGVRNKIVMSRKVKLILSWLAVLLILSCRTRINTREWEKRPPRNKTEWALRAKNVIKPSLPHPRDLL